MILYSSNDTFVIYYEDVIYLDVLDEKKFCLYLLIRNKLDERKREFREYEFEAENSIFFNLFL